MTTNKARKSGLALCATVAATLAITSSAHAALTLTAAGIANNFTLSTFYSEPGNTYGMLGMTTTSTGKVIGAGYGHGGLALFNDVDGQTYGSAVLTAPTAGTPTSVATVGGKTYVSLLGQGYFEVNTTTLALTPLVLATNLGGYYGMSGNFATGHLVASTTTGLWDINPLTGATHFITGGLWDGNSVSPDGKTVYAAGSGGIFGFNILSGANVFSYSSPHGSDGTGVISGGVFNGYVIADNNDGTIGLLNPFTGIETTIASGGTRGDLVGPDLTNGTLFLSTIDQEYRLGIKGGVIGGGGVPEPATWAMLIAGFGLVGTTLRRRRTLAA